MSFSEIRHDLNRARFLLEKAQSEQRSVISINLARRAVEQLEWEEFRYLNPEFDVSTVCRHCHKTIVESIEGERVTCDKCQRQLLEEQEEEEREEVFERFEIGTEIEEYHEFMIKNDFESFD